jgi:hypothetical protein
MKREGLKLTPNGYTCVNPECARPLYVEIEGERTEACMDCDPPREGLPTAFRLMAEAHGIEVTPGMTIAKLWPLLPPTDLNDEIWL